MANHKKILILYAHPAPHLSRINRLMINHVRALSFVAVHDLYENSPDFNIQVKYEQQQLIKADLIIFHHPFYWYSCPAILKEWQDLVLQHGFGYGTGGTALHGKDFMSVISTGGPENSYQHNGHHNFTMTELLRPFEQMSNLCGMNYLAPRIIHNIKGLSHQDMINHANDYQQFLEAYHYGNS